MSDLPTPADVLAKLAALGTPAAIAKHLQAQGCLGRPGTSFSCPVANYVKARTGAPVHLGATRYSCRVSRGPVPAEVGAFVRLFDVGEFPALIAPK